MKTVKECTMNCSPALGDLRTKEERMRDCEDCTTRQRHPNEYTHDEIIETCNVMRRFGGHFAHSIAEACMYADRSNKDRLLKAFAGLFHKYGPDSDFQRSK